MNNSKIEQFGFYYKDNKEDGFSFNFGELYGMDRKEIDFLYQSYKDCTKAGLAELKKANHGCFNTATRAEAIQLIKDDLAQAIESFNKLAFGSAKRPMNVDYHIVPKGDLTEALLVCCSNIWMLTELGEIKNDNYNGLNFMYSQDQSQTRKAKSKVYSKAHEAAMRANQQRKQAKKARKKAKR